MTSSGITVREPQQNPVLVSSITLTQKRGRLPVWIILVIHAELVSVRDFLVKGLYHSNLPSTLELVCDVPFLLHARSQTKFRNKIQFLEHVNGLLLRLRFIIVIRSNFHGTKKDLIILVCRFTKKKSLLYWSADSQEQAG